MPKALVLALGLVLALVLWGHAAPAAAQPLPPRPTPPPLPTATAAPTEEPRDDEDAEPREEAPGRITGTVIDQRTGAPARGVRVQVGDAVVESDGNGNYDRNGLAPGAYSVALLLGAEQGSALQPPATVQLEPGATVVQHLFFLSPAPAPAEVPTAAPLDPAPPAPTAAIVAAPAPAPPVVAPAAPVVPARLPASGAGEGVPGWLAPLGLLLLAAGTAAVMRVGRAGREA